MHVDTGHNFPEAIEFRDRRVAELGERLIVASVEDSIRAGRVVEETGPRASRNALQTVTLLDAIAEHGFDAAFGGARRDEERARAKERVLSFRDEFGQWEPKSQRPELWNLYNGAHPRGEHARVFPISNWTELDVWQYIAEEDLEVPSIYFAHEREVFARDGMLYAVSPFVQLLDGERPFSASVRYRTVGRHELHRRGGVARRPRSQEVVAEIAATEVTERGQTRADDRVIGGGDGGPQAAGVLLMAAHDSIDGGDGDGARRERQRARWPSGAQTRQDAAAVSDGRRASCSGASPSGRSSCCASPPRARSTTARAR